MGNRRFVLFSVVGVGLVLALSGCSLSGSANVTDDAAVSLGHQALSFSSPDSSSGTSSGLATSCPDSLKQALFAGLPSADVLTTLDAKSTTGPASDPGLTSGYIPSCAFAITVSGSAVDELYFVGMPQDGVDEITSRIPNESWVAGATTTITDGTQEVFARGAARLVVAHLTVDGVNVLLIAG